MKNEQNQAKIIGSRIRAAREHAGYPQIALAKELSFDSATAISLIENGERRVTADNLEKIARFLKTTVNSLMGISDKVDVVVALRADKCISAEDKTAIERFIEMAKKKHANIK